MDKRSNTKAHRRKTHTVPAGQPVFPSQRWPSGQPDGNDFPWQPGAYDLLTIPQPYLERLMQQARKFDPRAIEAFTALAIPVVKHYSNIRYYATLLGKEEARSIAIQTALEFLMHDKLRGKTKDIPSMLKRAIHCDLQNQAERVTNRLRMELRGTAGAANQETEEADAADVIQSLPADPRSEPEQQALLAEQRRLVRESLQSLSPRERQVILRLFFHRQRVAEIAVAMHCTPNAVSLLKYSALRKLRKVFTEKEIV